ncbi:MAG: serine/threonine-protein phosphatase [Chlorobi bacterium]|nr:serine/threonine-protein phosphatase [Chlorobiota bacterium]
MSRNKFRKIFDLYTSDLSFQEIERLIKRDAAEVYEFFKNDIPKEEGEKKNKFTRAFIFMRSLFNAFIMRLSPARRIFYLVAVLTFLIGYLNQINSYLLISFIIVNILLAFELADKLLTKDELTIARKIQTGLMPKNPPKLEKFEISAYYEAAKEVGGDYYDIIQSNGKTILLVGDISGKGMAAAIYMVRVQAIIHTLLSRVDNIKDLMIRLKSLFDQKLLPEYFLTLIAASINEDDSINLCSAGHQPAIYYKKSEEKIYELNPKGIGLGLNDHGAFEKILEMQNVKPESGDIFLFYTDGLNEAMDCADNQFGIERIKNLIASNHDLSAKEINIKIRSALDQFCCEDAKRDDLSMIVLKMKNNE